MFRWASLMPGSPTLNCGGSPVGCSCVLALLADKDAPAVVAELQTAVAAWYCAGLEGDRGQTGTALARRLEQADGALEIQVFKSVTQALDAAISDSGPADGVLVFGSFLTATEALQHLAPDTDRILTHGPGQKAI